MDLALNNLQRLICHKTPQTKPNQTKPKGNVIARLEFELAYFKAAVQQFCHYVMRSRLIVKQRIYSLNIDIILFSYWIIALSGSVRLSFSNVKRLNKLEMMNENDK